ncbi:hypothetical protein ACHAWU_007773 [Discostella pseudostelligera]|uniref:Uncharacterized protein n=1 Tax=Discostella pseudostelligera TaxID=259834 RepID=A0ABD3MHK6_9STRA
MIERKIMCIVSFRFLTLLERKMVKPTRSLSETDDVVQNRTMTSSLKSNLSIGRSKSNNAHFHAHFLASRRLADSLHIKPKSVEAKVSFKCRTSISEKLSDANRRWETSMQRKQEAAPSRIVAWEDDADIDLLAAIVKADCVVHTV